MPADADNEWAKMCRALAKTRTWLLEHGAGGFGLGPLNGDQEAKDLLDQVERALGRRF